MFICSSQVLPRIPLSMVAAAATTVLSRLIPIPRRCRLVTPTGRLNVKTKKNHAHSIQKLIWVAPNLSAIKSTHRWPRGFRSSSELGVTFDFDRRFHMYPRRRARRPVHVGNGLLDITRGSRIVKSRGHVSRCRSRPVTC
jgi:hypothetical protein